MKILVASRILHPSMGGPYKLITELVFQLINKIRIKKIKIITYANIFSIFSLSRKVKNFDIIHFFGAWDIFGVLLFLLATVHKKKYIITPMGAYLNWALNQKKIKKKIALFLYQKLILINADAVHVTSHYELNCLKAIDNRINGIIIDHGIFKESKISKKFFINKKKKAIFFSRVHKKKGIDILLKSWMSLKPYNWQLDIYGPKEDSNFLKFIAQHNYKNIKYHGPVYDLEKKKKIFLESDLFILPTFEENFGLSILEAFMFKVPVLTTENTAFGNIEKKNQGWICEPEFNSLKKKLQVVLNSKKKIFKKYSDQAFKSLIKYNLTNISKKHLNLYLKVLSK